MKVHVGLGTSGHITMCSLNFLCDFYNVGLYKNKYSCTQMFVVGSESYHIAGSLETFHKALQ